MSIHCDVILRSASTPDELAALGAALWRWYSRAWGDAVLCQSVDSQALADLLAGKRPDPSRSPWLAGRRGIHFRVPAEAYPDRLAIITSLRHDLPPAAVEQVLVDGVGWDAINRPPTAGPALTAPPPGEGVRP